jgi:hypothetical protein
MMKFDSFSITSLTQLTLTTLSMTKADAVASPKMHTSQSSVISTQIQSMAMANPTRSANYFLTPALPNTPHLQAQVPSKQPSPPAVPTQNKKEIPLMTPVTSMTKTQVTYASITSSHLLPFAS